MSMSLFYFTLTQLQVDWSLPMSEDAQVIFFKKVRFTFNRATVGIPVSQRKKYRLNAEQMLQVRNLCCLFAQIWPSLSTKLPPDESSKIEKAFIETAGDDDFAPLLISRPPRIALSMLKSQKEQAARQERQKQDMIHSDLQSQRDAVQSAQWAYFCTALEQDQATLSKISQVPAKVKSKLHAKTVARRQAQAEAGQKAVCGYQDHGWFELCVWLPILSDFSILL